MLLGGLRSAGARSDTVHLLQFFPSCCTIRPVDDPGYPGETFQFFPSCCPGFQVTVLSCRCQTFNSFPVAAGRRADHRGLGTAPELSILSQLLPWGISPQANGAGLAFNSFPVAAPLKPYRYSPLTSRLLSILSQLLPAQLALRAAERLVEALFQFFPSCCLGSPPARVEPYILSVLSILSQLLLVGEWVVEAAAQAVAFNSFPVAACSRNLARSRGVTMLVFSTFNSFPVAAVVDAKIVRVSAALYSFQFFPSCCTTRACAAR